MLSPYCFIVTPSNKTPTTSIYWLQSFFLMPAHNLKPLRRVYGDRPVIWARATTAKLGNDWMVRSTQSDWFVTASLRHCWPTREDFWCSFIFHLSPHWLSSSVSRFPLSSTFSIPIHLDPLYLTPSILPPQLPPFNRTSHPSVLLSMLSPPDNHLNSTLPWQPLWPSRVVWVRWNCSF